MAKDKKGKKKDSLTKEPEVNKAPQEIEEIADSLNEDPAKHVRANFLYSLIISVSKACNVMGYSRESRYHLFG